MESYNDIRLERMIEKRPHFKSRAVVTSGMPYGNKFLHIGHAMMWVHSDIFARFLRDRLGSENVVHISGTDTFGSPCEVGYKSEVAKGYTGSIKEYALSKQSHQKATFDKYEIGINLFSGSCMDNALPIHTQVSKEIIDKLHKNGYLKKVSTEQFYDEKMKCFLNGRQVVGKCPIEGCQAEKGYADECDLGHQYMPSQLIDPISVLSGEKPVFKKVENWYFTLDKQIDLLNDWLDYLQANTPTRQYLIKEIREFLKKPEINIKKEYLEDYNKIANTLPTHTLDNQDKKPSFTLIFEELEDREKAVSILSNNNIFYRTGKTLVPFRLTGNVEWGVQVPKEYGDNLTFWVWPESLWAPISFTKEYLLSIGKDDKEWERYWKSLDSQVYQFIGEDNIYFYGAPQTAMWLCMNKEKSVDVKEGDFSIPQLVSDKHILFLGKKASSSGKVKPPLAHELLDHYTAEQLRMHFLAMNVGNNNANFMPKVFNPDANPDEIDPVIKEGNLLTNVFNRVLRSLFYTWQKDFDGVMPYGQVEQDILKDGMLTLLKYEKIMSEQKLHMISYELDSYIRNINKYWATNSKMFDKGIEFEKQVIVNCLHMVRIAMIMLHPVVPVGIENVADFLKVDKSIFSWEFMDKDIYHFVNDKQNHKPEFLQPRQDFFKKHSTQLVFDEE